ncbi:hypothetical protein FA95DRAFT_121639 [Auriscalpium vulgare]|uniref:Uncharacterized protein n=1 Tax=Auriscalpium vulgare TaxID=40419 RepID=A0ACB8RNP6_9AGAM|nr:hypothetical protein FA95DRAFT_121639 [Auriscalpium vulgare]
MESPQHLRKIQRQRPAGVTVRFTVAISFAYSPKSTNSAAWRTECCESLAPWYTRWRLAADNLSLGLGTQPTNASPSSVNRSFQRPSESSSTARPSSMLFLRHNRTYFLPTCGVFTSSHSFWLRARVVSRSSTSLSVLPHFSESFLWLSALLGPAVTPAPPFSLAS